MRVTGIRNSKRNSSRLYARLLFLCLAASISLAVLFTPALAQVCAAAGNDGPASISGTVNTYFPGVVGTTVSAGATSIPVAAANINGSATPIAAGDLLLVLQMQDATINTTNSANYGGGAGTGSGYTGGTSGTFEFVYARNAVPTTGGTIQISPGTVNSYVMAAATGTRGQRTYQVIRVPQYSSATIAGTVTAAAWDGSSGGVISIDVAGTLSLNGGTLNAAGKGFRGGGALTLGGGTGTNTDYRFTSTTWGASKGEGIAGTQRYVYDGSTVIDRAVEGYPSGSFGRGAPGNAGGGGNDGDPPGNDQNSGGGGGSNGGAGGRGGNSWSSNLAVGGFGGSAFTQAGITRLIMGGGGGAGTSNNGAAATSSGGAGGGIVMLRAGSLSGSGTINVNGADAPNSQPTCCDDGAGGGGGGGSALIIATNTAGLGSLSVTARGGKGGNTLSSGAGAHGPGGGGGGGVVMSNAATGGVSPVAGGLNGTTDGGIAYNSTAGSAGVINSAVSILSVPGIRAGASCIPVLTVTKSTSTATVVAGNNATYSITVANAANTSDATSVSVSDSSLPSGFTFASTGSVSLNGGATRPSTTNPAVGAGSPTWSTFTIPGGASVVVTFQAAVSATQKSGTYQNPASATYLDPTRTVSNGTATSSYSSASSTAEDVTINPPSVALAKSISPSGTQQPGTDLAYTIQYTNSGGTAAQNLAIVDQVPDNTDFKIGSQTSTPGSTGLTIVIEYSNDYDPLSPGTATWTYTPVSAGGGAASGYDRQVKALRWRVTAGNLSPTAPNNTATIGFTAKIR